MITTAAQIPTYDGTITVVKLIAILMLAMIALGVAIVDGKVLTKSGIFTALYLVILGVLVWYA